MNILLINQPLNNRGDESAHKALLRKIIKEYPNAHIKVMFVGSNDNSIQQFTADDSIQYINIKPIKGWAKIAIFALKHNLPLIWKIIPTTREIINLYKSTDIIINAPGGICMGGFQDWIHILLLSIAKHLNKKIAYYGRSFGPFPTKTKSNRQFKKISLDLLNYFSFISIRDKKTENLALELGINYTTTVDSAFLNSEKVGIPNTIRKQIGDKKYMVFVPNLLIWHYAYKDKLTKEGLIGFYMSIISLIKSTYPEYNIVMLPQTFNYNSYEGDDINFFKDIAKQANDERIIIIDDKYSSDIQQSIISQAEFLIGARYHSVVFAINNNIPFIALSYEHKISGLLISLNKQDRSIDITNLKDNPQENQDIINHINILIKDLKPDNETTLKAQAIANECFEKFKISTLDKI